MKQSEQIDQLITALLAAKKDFKSPEKDGKNSFFNNSYATLESIARATEGPLNKNDLLITQGADYVEGKMVVVTTLMHSSGQFISHSAPLLPVKQDSQSLGAAVTYMKRYGWAAILGLTGFEIDDDGESERTRREESEKLITKQQLEELKSIVNHDETRLRNIQNHLMKTKQINSLEKMPQETYITLKNHLQKKAVSTV